MTESTPNSVLIVRLSALGDVVHVLPALTALRQRWPAAKLGWLVESGAAGVLRGHPDLDRLHVVERGRWLAALSNGRGVDALTGLRRLIADVRRERYALALDFQSNFRSGLLSWLSGAPRRLMQPVRYSKEGASRWFASERPPAVGPERHKIARNLALLGPLGIATSLTDPPRPRFPADDQAEALAARFRAIPGPRAVLQPGVSAFGALKAWPEESFAELARLLAAEGVRPFVAYGPGEEPLARRVVRQAGPGVELAPATRSLHQLIALLGAADLFVGVDSGPLHLAAAQGTPVLGLYGPKHPGTYGPFYAPHRVVRAGLECSPCRHRRCPRPDVELRHTPEGIRRLSPCMVALAPGRALAAARELLSLEGART